MAKEHFSVLIVGGGTGGITVASRLVGRKPFGTIGLIEPSETHYYQPIWTLVGAGIVPKEMSRRQEVDFIPAGVSWIRDRVTAFHPETREVALGDRRISYDYLVVAVGMEIFWDRIPGLKESLGKNGVCSNYSYETVDSTWNAIRNFKGGKALFTFPSTPIKCGGAPQKIMYLAEHYFRKSGVRGRSVVSFFSAGQAIFGVPKYAQALSKVVADRGIQTHFKKDLVEIRGKTAVFRDMETKALTEESFDLIHVTPPMGAPSVVRVSTLADAAGFVEVHKHTLQHTRFPEVFALGDASSLPTSRTGAAIRKQAPVLVENLTAQAKGQPLTAKYDGYTSCPLVTSYDTVILAEFDYDGNPKETFPFDQSKERRSMYWLKRFLLPALYWHGMLRGRA